MTSEAPERRRALPENPFDGRIDPAFRVETSSPKSSMPPRIQAPMQWFIDNHPDVPEHIEMTQRSARGVRRLLSW